MYYTRRQLQLFLAVAEHGGVSAAARACHVTQPTVSMQLRELADAVGLPLYEQIGRRLHLTPAGEALAATARAMNDEWNSFEQRIAALKGLTEGRLRVAVVSTAKYFIPRMLGQFCKQHPGIDVALAVENRDGVVMRLRNNADDLYIMSQPPADIEVERHTFLPNPLVVIAPREHPLAARKRIALDSLAGEPFVMREPGSGTRLACEAHFAQAGFAPRIRLELGSNEAIRQAVEGELGLGIVSLHALAGVAPGERPAVLPVSGFPIRSSWSILYPLGKRLSPIASVFLDYLKATAGELADELALRA
jgi:DNA-binding transcriptional LysR family regulator